MIFKCSTVNLFRARSEKKKRQPGEEGYDPYDFDGEQEG